MHNLIGRKPVFYCKEAKLLLLLLLNLMLNKSKNTMKYFALILFAGILISCSDQEVIRSAEGDVVDITKLPVSEERELTAGEVANLEREHNLTITGGSAVKAFEKLSCRWSDDEDGKTYGLVSCEGRCGVVSSGNNRIGIGCFDGDGNTIRTGAYRDINP